MPIYQQSDFRKGMTYALFNYDLSDPEYKASLDRLADTGCNWIALAVGWWQQSKRAIEIYPHPSKTPQDEQLEDLIDYIHALGMKILFKPFVDSEDHTWRAEFRPSDIPTWFKSYERFILHYSCMAEKKQIALFSIGCENVLGNKAKQEYWRQIIQLIRKAYSGQLTYAANFNRSVSYRKVRFWDVLDFIGIDAYFSVANRPVQSVEKLIRKWKRRISRIEDWHSNNHPDKDILFTELGICSYHGAAQKPWAYPDNVQANLQEQCNYYESFFESFSDREWLKGVFWWWWDNPSTSDYIGNRNEADSKYAYFFTPQGKPAEQMLRNYYV